MTTENNVSTSTSIWQSFATALFDPKDWDRLGAHWINGGNTDADDNSLGEPKGKIPAKQLRSEFSLPSAVHDSMAHASLFWVGVGYGKLWLNGEEVGADEALGELCQLMCCFVQSMFKLQLLDQSRGQCAIPHCLVVFVFGLSLFCSSAFYDKCTICHGGNIIGDRHNAVLHRYHVHSSTFSPVLSLALNALTCPFTRPVDNVV